MRDAIEDANRAVAAGGLNSVMHAPSVIEQEFGGARVQEYGRKP